MAAAASPNSYVIIWGWITDAGIWRPYEPKTCHLIEKCYQERSKTVNLGMTDPQLACYRVDLETMLQIRQETGTARIVAREIYSVDNPLGKGIMWQWSGDAPGQWHMYDINVSCALENAFLKKVRKVDLSKIPPFLPYTVDLVHMTQMRHSTCYVRQVQRINMSNPYPQLGEDEAAGIKAETDSDGHPIIPRKHAHSDSSVESDTLSSPKKHQRKKQLNKIDGQTSPEKKSSPSVFKRLTRSSSRFKNDDAHDLNNQTENSGNNYTSTDTNTMSNLNPAAVSASTNSPAHSSSSVTTLMTSPTRAVASRLSPAMSGVTSMLMSPIVPVMITNPPYSIMTPPLINKSQIKPVPGVPSPSRRLKKKSSKSSDMAKTSDDVLRKYSSKVRKPPTEEQCSICYENLAAASTYDESSIVIKLERCGHMFHKSCLQAMYDSGQKDGHIQCPTCKTIYGEKRGIQPPGTMDYHVIPYSLAGNLDCDTIRIIYNIPNGQQGSEHPHPGQRYTARGFPRHCYLPNNEKGQKVLRLLIRAWERRLIFTVGASATTGEQDTVTWNEIHHKTEFGSNISGHGYPDANYLDNVLLELAAQGVLE